MSFTVYVFASHLHDCNLLRSFKSQLPQERLRSSSIDFRPSASGPFTSCAIVQLKFIALRGTFWPSLNALSFPLIRIERYIAMYNKGGVGCIKNAPTMPVALNMAAFYIILSDNVAPLACCYFAIFVRLWMAETFLKLHLK